MNLVPRARELISGVIFTAVCLVAAPVVLLRLFGYLFFAGTTSTWAIVPALLLAILVPVSVRPFPWRRAVASTLGAAYLFSLFIYGWDDMQFRISEGQSTVLDGVEAALLFILMTRCFIHSADKL